MVGSRPGCSWSPCCWSCIIFWNYLEKEIRKASIDDLKDCEEAPACVATKEGGGPRILCCEPPRDRNKNHHHIFLCKILGLHEQQSYAPRFFWFTRPVLLTWESLSRDPKHCSSKQTLRSLCLQRYLNRCVLTGLYDPRTFQKLPDDQQEGIEDARTGCAHIIPYSTALAWSGQRIDFKDVRKS